MIEDLITMNLKIDWSEYLHIYNDLYTAGILTEHCKNYIKFSQVKRIFDIIHNRVVSLSQTFSSLDDALKIDDQAQFGSITFSNGKSIVFIFEVRNKDDHYASFDPFSTPYEMCINLTSIKNLNQTTFSNYLSSDAFKAFLFHEVTHFVQTLSYPFDEIIRNHRIEMEGSYMRAPLEIEACLFMTIADALANGIELHSFNDTKQYLNNSTPFYLSTAKSVILKNEDAVQDIFNHNEMIESMINEAEEMNDFAKFEICIKPCKKSSTRPISYSERNYRFLKTGKFY